MGEEWKAFAPSLLMAPHPPGSQGWGVISSGSLRPPAVAVAAGSVLERPSSPCAEHCPSTSAGCGCSNETEWKIL